MTTIPAMFVLLVALFVVPDWACASSGSLQPSNLTQHEAGFLALGLFALAYGLAMFEEVTELRKSKPMVLAASLIWIVIAVVYAQKGLGGQAGVAFRAGLEGYIELFLFIMVSMTYLNAMENRGVFEKLRIWLLSKNFSYRQLFWVTGCLSFSISSFLNNLTTALLMGSVVLALGKSSRRFVTLGCINIVVASNAGGSFSPFGDITTLLVWQKGVVPFFDFFALLLPAIVNFALPAAIMHFFIPNEKSAATHELFFMKRGGLAIIGLFVMTVITATSFENFLDLPPAAGMMMGLTYLKFFSFYLQKTGAKTVNARKQARKIDYFAPLKYMNNPKALAEKKAQGEPSFDVFSNVANLEWDTLLFFYGVMMAVSGLSFIGYLEWVSHALYGDLDPSIANILVGIASAFVDNGTIMLAVLTMAPDISQGQWLLATLTAGVGGSMLAIGSAAGVGLMGRTKGVYTFSHHLKWTPVIALGYAASIACHFWLNSRFFTPLLSG